MKGFWGIILLLIFFACTPKGPQTYSSPLVGKSKNELIRQKGIAKNIKIFGENQAFIYVTREAYYGNKNPADYPGLKPKKIVDIEHIYYINTDDVVYKYQVWKKKVTEK